MSLPREHIDCPSMAVANEIRQRYPDLLVPEDDERSTTVTVSGDALDEWLDDIGWIAYREDRLEGSKTGQAKLSPGERECIDFQKTNVPHAASCKAIAASNGVDDWLAYYDPSLSVDEHREIYSRGQAGETTLRRLVTEPAMD